MQERGELVYVGSMKKLVYGAKIFSLFTSSVAVLSQPLMINALKSAEVMKIVFPIMIGSMAVITPTLLHVLTKSFVTELYFNKEENKFTALTKGIFLNTISLSFVPEDCEMKALGFPFANVEVKKVPLFFIDSDFLDSEAFHVLYGLNKPFSANKEVKSATKM